MARTVTDYVVYRHGSNGANQAMTQVMPVGIYTGTGVTARDRIEDACRQAGEEHTIYANQYLSAKPVTRTSADDYTSAGEYQQGEAMFREQNA